MKTIETLKAEKSALLATRNFNDATLKACKDIETQIADIKRIELLNSVNAKQTRLRELANQAYNCEQAPQSIFNNDGTPHSSKVKKYPNLAAIKYIYAKFEDNNLTELRINGEKFRMYAQKYEYNKPTEYTRPATFDDFLELNGILTQDLTISELIDLENKTNEINAEFEAAVKKFDAAKSKLNLYHFSNVGLLSQTNAGHIYKFTTTH